MKLRQLRPNWLVAGGLPVALILAGVLLWGFSLPVPINVSARRAPERDPAAFTALAETIETRFPERTLGTAAHAEFQGWLLNELTAAGLEPITQTFTVLAGHPQPQTGQNIWVTLPGDKAETIILTTAIDTPTRANPTYTSNAHAVATLLTLAADRPLSGFTLLFLFADADTYGPAWGTQVFLDAWPQRENLSAVLELQSGVATQTRLDFTGFQRGYTPIWLRATAHPALMPDPLTELGQRINPLSPTSAGRFLRADIPAMRLETPATDEARAWTVEWLINVMGIEPDPALFNPYDWQITADRYVSGIFMSLVGLLIFAPLWAAIFWQWKLTRPTWPSVWPELVVVGGLVVAGLDGYGIALLLVATGVLPRFEEFPALRGDPFLLTPTWWAVLVIYGGAALFAWLLFRRFYGAARVGVLLPTDQRLFSLRLLLGAVALGATLFNPFAALLLVAPTVYLWWWVEPRPGRLGFFLNAYLCVVGLLPLFLWVGQWDKAIYGFWWWWLPIAAAYRTFSPLEPVLFCLALALALRFAMHSLNPALQAALGRGTEGTVGNNGTAGTPQP